MKSNLFISYINKIDFILNVLITLLIINAKTLNRSIIIPLTLLCLNFSSKSNYLIVWSIGTILGGLDQIEWMFWGVVFANLFNRYHNIVTSLVTLIWTIESTRLGQNIINLSLFIGLIKIFYLLFSRYFYF